MHTPRDTHPKRPDAHFAPPVDAPRPWAEDPDDGDDDRGYDRDDASYGGPYVPAKRRVWTSVVAALLATTALVSLLLVHVWSRFRVLDLGYQVSTMSRTRETLLEEQRRLQIEVQVLTRAERLEPVARRQMALIAPLPQQILYVPASELALPPLPSTAPKGASPLAPLTMAPVAPLQQGALALRGVEERARYE
jgi:cell division protein FtsL